MTIVVLTMVIVTMTIWVLSSSRIERTIPASRFKAQCLALLDEVAESGVAIVVTKHGKPVARLEPHRAAAVPSRQRHVPRVRTRS